MNPALLSSVKMDWRTPQGLFDGLDVVGPVYLKRLYDLNYKLIMAGIETNTDVVAAGPTGLRNKMSVMDDVCMVPKEVLDSAYNNIGTYPGVVMGVDLSNAPDWTVKNPNIQQNIDNFNKQINEAVANGLLQQKFHSKN